MPKPPPGGLFIPKARAEQTSLQSKAAAMPGVGLWKCLDGLGGAICLPLANPAPSITQMLVVFTETSKPTKNSIVHLPEWVGSMEMGDPSELETMAKRDTRAYAKRQFTFARDQLPESLARTG